MKNINKMNSPYFFKKNKKDRIQRQPFSGSNQNKIFYFISPNLKKKSLNNKIFFKTHDFLIIW